MSLSRSHAIELRNRMLSGFARVRNHQIEGSLINLDDKGNPVGACAMGALALGYYNDADAIKRGDLTPWPEHIPLVDVGHPITEEVDDLESTIVDLNDNNHWTVERIAEWIACLPTQDCTD